MRQDTGCGGTEINSRSRLAATFGSHVNLRARTGHANAATACLVLLAAGCAERSDGAAAEAVAGWSEVPEAPYSATLTGMSSFWAGDRLVVTGGHEISDDAATFSTASYEYTPDTNTWTEGAPLRIRGFDGLLGADGVWTGRSWVGWASPCNSGPLIEGDPINSCEAVPVGVRWDPVAGWSSLPLPPESFGDGDTVIDIAGATQDSAVLTTNRGFILAPVITAAAWSFSPWPASSEPYDPSAACVIGERIVSVTSDLGQTFDQSLNESRPQTLSASTLATNGDVVDQYVVGDVPGRPIPAFCQANEGLYLDGASYGRPLQLATVDGASVLAEAPTQATGDLSRPVALVSPEWLDVGEGVVSWDVLGATSYFLEATTGRTVPLQPVPTMGQLHWSGQFVLANPANTTSWFIFLPDGPWDQASHFPFPQ